MTQTLAVTTTNDLFIGSDGNLAVARGLSAVMTAAQQAAQAQLGEMVFAVDRGIPNFDVVWNGAPNVPQFEAFLRRNILRVADVVEVPNITTRVSGGILSYTAEIRTTYGNGVLNG